MDIVRLAKKHLAIILPAGITLVAIGLFVPTLMAGRGVKAQMEESIAMGGQIDSLASSAPSANEYKAAKEYEQAHAGDACSVTSLAQQTSQRDLLVYGIFPEPNATETSSLIFTNFGKAYRKAIEDMVAGLRARDCPTETEIAEATRSGAGGDAGQYAGNLTFEGGSRNEAIVERVCMDRADSTPVYASPDIFCGYGFWENYNYIGRNEAIDDCWKSQLAYWIQKDVVDTIAAIDKDFNSVAKSPVKRLVGISFTTPFKADAMSKREISGVVDFPRYILAKTEGLTFAWTDRIGNDDMDVVHFALSVVVNNKAVQPFMKELCSQKTHVFKGWLGQGPPQNFVHNQITVLKSEVEPLTRPAGMTADRYRYGDDAVVQLNLVCEYVFDKAGYAAVKPSSNLAKTAEAGGMQAAPQTQPRTPRMPGRRSKKAAEE
jgi:hypothetical protein